MLVKNKTQENYDSKLVIKSEYSDVLDKKAVKSHFKKIKIAIFYMKCPHQF